MTGVYLLHISPPYKHAGHYLGYADDITARVAAHQAGYGARLTQVAVDAGCDLVLVRTWPGEDRTFERKLKNGSHVPKLCPVCKRVHGQPDPLAHFTFTLADVTELAF